MSLGFCAKNVSNTCISTLNFYRKASLKRKAQWGGNNNHELGITYRYRSPLVSMFFSNTAFTYNDQIPDPSLHPARRQSVGTACWGNIPPLSMTLSMIKVVAIPYMKKESTFPRLNRQKKHFICEKHSFGVWFYLIQVRIVQKDISLAGWLTASQPDY